MTATLSEIADQIRTDRLEEAQRSLKTTQETSENRSDVRFLRGYLQERQLDRSGALEQYEALLVDDPDHIEATFRAALLHDLWGDDDVAMELYRRCTTCRPAHVHALLNLAVLAEERERLSEAERCVQAVLAEHPNHARALRYLESIDASYSMKYDERSQREREQRDAILDLPISDFELSVRSRNCLHQMNIRTLGDLLRASEAELLAFKNFGETSLNEIQAMLALKGLRLGQSLATALEVSEPITEGPLGEAARTQLNRPVSELELSVRARKCLQRLGIVTIAELTVRSEAELLSAKNFGQTSLAEIKTQLAEFGLALRNPA